jgi:hypothetical protein
VSGTATVGSGGYASLALNLSSLSDGAVTVTATLRDAAANSSRPGGAATTKRTVAPLAPTVALNPASDSGVSSADYITSVSSPSFLVGPAAGATTTVYVNGIVYSGQKLADGAYTVTARSTDPAGNMSPTATAPRTLIIDTAGPTGSFTVSGAQVVGGQLSTASTTPTLTLGLSDARSGVATIAISTDGGVTYGPEQAYSSAATISLGPDGVYPVVVRATDAAGNVSTFTPPTGSVRVDTTPPVISASLSPAQQTIGYDGTANISVSYNATDLSTVTSLTAKLDGVAFSGGVLSIYQLTAGWHTLVLASVDGLGNASSVTLTFQVRPSLNGVVAAVNDAAGRGVVSAAEQSKLVAILRSGSSQKAALASFIAEVQKVSGTKALTSAEANLLLNWAQDLSARS